MLWDERKERKDGDLSGNFPRLVFLVMLVARPRTLALQCLICGLLARLVPTMRLLIFSISDGKREEGIEERFAASEQPRVFSQWSLFFFPLFSSSHFSKYSGVTGCLRNLCFPS